MTRNISFYWSGLIALGTAAVPTWVEALVGVTGIAPPVTYSWPTEKLQCPSATECFEQNCSLQEITALYGLRLVWQLLDVDRNSARVLMVQSLQPFNFHFRTIH